MPNAINRTKPNQLLKVEKDNENKDIRRKQKFFQKAPQANKQRPHFVSVDRPEPVWERSNKAKNQTLQQEGPRNRNAAPSTSTHRLPTVHLVGQVFTTPNKKVLHPNFFQSQGRPNQPRRLLKKSSKRKPNKEDIIYLKPLTIEEIMGVRPLVKSSESSRAVMKPMRHNYRKSFAVEDVATLMSTTRKDIEYFSESTDEKESSDLLSDNIQKSIESPDCSATSSKIISSFRGALASKQKSMAPAEMKLIKDVVKTDNRHRSLRTADSKLFKDILKTQLENILTKELVVKAALGKLDEDIGEDVVRKEIETETAITYAEDINKPRVDVVFKNVPSLEREIIILKALGEKLEATLKRTKSQCNLDVNIDDGDSPRSASTCTTMEKVLHEVSYHFSDEHSARVKIQPIGIVQNIGLAQEYSIAHKTIVELKQEAETKFYLPADGKETKLMCTSFTKLKENPNMFMRYLKPKSKLIPFNVLDQDPMFLNSYIYKPKTSVNHCQLSGPLLRSQKQLNIDCMYKDTTRKTTVIQNKEMGTKMGVGLEDASVKLATAMQENITPPNIAKPAANQASPVVTVKKKETKKNRPPVARKTTAKVVPKECPPTAETAQRSGPRRRVHRSASPMPQQKPQEPKNSLLKTILVGAVQIAIFLLLIMAFTYPELKC